MPTVAATAPDSLSDEELRKLWKPQVSEEDAYRILDASYVPEGTARTIVRPLDSYDDVNYMVRMGDDNFLLKIHNGLESRDYLRVLEAANGDYFQPGQQGSVVHFQTALMQVLHAHGIPTSVPQPPIVNNEKHIPVSVHELPVVTGGNRRLVVRLLSWTPGTPMSAIRALPVECLCESGQALGKIANAFESEQFQALDQSIRQGPAMRFHQWDGKHTADLEPFVRHIPNPRRQAMIRSILRKFTTDVVDSGDANTFRTGILHGDFNDANIIVNPEDLSFGGVIDFGDSVESWRVLDVTIAMAYAMLTSYGKGQRQISAAAAILRGFHSIYPLTDVERKHLVLLVACRLACSVTLGAYSYQQNPENKYLLLHAEPAWNALELIWGYDDDEGGSERRAKVSDAIQQVFARACDRISKVEGSGAIDCSDICIPDPTVVDLLQSIRAKEYASDTKRQKTNDPKVITFVTGNKKKLEEVQRILQFDDSSPYRLDNFKVDLPELQGDPISIAKEKCRLAADKIGGPVITEDTSLCFNALNGLPGPYIKWFLDSCGHDGLNKMIGSFDDKTGYAQTVVAFSLGPGQEPIVFDGRTDGAIVAARGKLDFGWDPIFEPHEAANNHTYAEMSKDEKDAISHRSRAFAKLRDHLAS